MPDFFDYNESFNLFGFKLNSDDVLLLTILFILYLEENKDIYLYIVLFLLLLC